MRIGVVDDARIRLHTSSPESFGSLRSSITRSGDSSASRRSAVSPSYAVTISYPSSPSSHAPRDDLRRAPPVAAHEDRLPGAGTGELVPASHRGGLPERRGYGRAEIEAGPPKRELGAVAAHTGEDPVDELVEALDLRCRLGDRVLRRPVPLGEHLEVAADHGEWGAEVVRDDRDEVRARSLELAEALGCLALERVERGLVDRERRLVRERADEPDFLLEELLVVGNLQHL